MILVSLSLALPWQHKGTNVSVHPSKQGTLWRPCGIDRSQFNQEFKLASEVKETFSDGADEALAFPSALP